MKLQNFGTLSVRIYFRPENKKLIIEGKTDTYGCDLLVTNPTFSPINIILGPFKLTGKRRRELLSLIAKATHASHGQGNSLFTSAASRDVRWRSG